MNVELASVMPLDRFLEPTISFKVNLTHDSTEVPLAIRGLLIAEDGKALCPLHETEGLSLAANTEVGNISGLGTHRDSNLRHQKKQEVHLRATLTERCVVHLDRIRNRNKKGDVNF